MTLVLSFAATLILSQTPVTPPPASPTTAPPSGAVAPTAEGSASWKDVPAEKLGPVRPLLVDKPELRVAPKKHFSFDRFTLGEPGAIATMSNVPYSAFLTYLNGRIELRTFHHETGAIGDAITTVPLQRPPAAFDEGPDGKSLILRATPEAPILLYDIPSGSLRATIETESAGVGDVHVLDESTLVVVTEQGIIRRFSAVDGSGKGMAQTAPIRVFTAGKGHVVGVTAKDPPNPPGVQADRTMVVESANVETGARAGKARVPAGPAAFSAFASTFVVGETAAGAWHGVRVLDLVTLTEKAKLPVEPHVSSIGLELSPDGRTMFMLEYIAQPVIAWNTTTAAPFAVYGPERGGCIRFDVSNDGKVLTAIVGPWVEGSLIPEGFEVFDVRPPS